MSHGITRFDKAVYAYQPAWHGLGEVVDELMSPQEAFNRAFGWEPTLIDLYAGESDTPLEGWKASVRDDTQAVLSVVGKDFNHITNRGICEFIGNVTNIGGLGRNRISTAASLFGGENVFVSADLGGWELVRKATGQPDVYHSYLASLSGHTGMKAWYAFYTDTRVVCSNTAQFSLGRASEQSDRAVLTRLKHTAKASERMEEAEQLMGAHLAYQTKLRAELEALEEQRINARQTREWAAHVLGNLDEYCGNLNMVQNKLNEDWDPKTKVNMKTPGERVIEAADTVGDLFTTGKGNLGSTKYDAIQGLTEFLDHHRDRYKRAKDANKWQSQRLVDTFTGKSAQIRNRGLRMLKKW